MKYLNKILIVFIYITLFMMPAHAQVADALTIRAVGADHFIDPNVGSVIDISTVFDNEFKTDYEYLKVSFSNIDTTIFKPVEGCEQTITNLPKKTSKTFKCKVQLQSKFYTSAVKTPYYLYGTFEGANSGVSSIPSPIPSSSLEKGGTASIKIEKTSNNIPTSTPTTITTTSEPQSTNTSTPTSTDTTATPTNLNVFNFKDERPIQEFNPIILWGILACICIFLVVFIGLVIFIVFKLIKSKGQKLYESQKEKTEP